MQRRISSFSWFIAICDDKGRGGEDSLSCEEALDEPWHILTPFLLQAIGTGNGISAPGFRYRHVDLRASACAEIHVKSEIQRRIKICYGGGETSVRLLPFHNLRGCVLEAVFRGLETLPASHQRDSRIRKNTRQVTVVDRLWSVHSRKQEKAGSSSTSSWRSSRYKSSQITIDSLRVMTRWTVLTGYPLSEWLWVQVIRSNLWWLSWWKIMGYEKYGLRRSRFYTLHYVGLPLVAAICGVAFCLLSFV